MKVFAIHCGRCGKGGAIEIEGNFDVVGRPMELEVMPGLPSTWDCPACRAINRIEWHRTDADPVPTKVIVVAIEGRRAPPLPRNLAELSEWAVERDSQVYVKRDGSISPAIVVAVISKATGRVYHGNAQPDKFPTFAEALDAAAEAAFAHWLQENPRPAAG